MSMPNSDAKTEPESEQKDLSLEDTIKFLGEEEESEKLDLKEEKAEEKPEEKKEEPEEETEEEEEAKTKTVEDELEEELEEPTEEDLELVTPVRRREILAKYPKLFKDFPYLERAYYREQKFTEVFPTIEDAQTASQKSQTLDSIEKDLVDGNTERLLTAVKQHDQKSFNKIVDDYLVTLGKIDQNAQFHVIGNVIRDTISTMFQEGNRSNSEALKNAAIILNQFVFGTSDFKPATRLTTEEKPDTKSEEISRKEKELTQRQFDNARQTLTTRVDNILKATVDGNIDPRNSMTTWVKKTAVRETLESLENAIQSDSRFRTIMDRLWEKAFEDGFSSSSLDRIKSAYLSKAKTLLPSIIKQTRNEALRGVGKRVREDSEESSPKKPLPVGRATSSNSSGKNDRERAQSIPRGMKTIDFLNQE